MAMNYMKNSRNFALALASSLFLGACGGGGGSDSADGGGGGSDTTSGFSGNQNPATIGSNDDAKNIAYAGTEGVYQTINSETVGVPVGSLVQEVNTDSVREALRQELVALIQDEELGTLPVSATVLLEGECGGDIQFESSNEQAGGGFDATYIYNNYCVNSGAEQVTVNGTADYTSTSSGGELDSYTITQDLTYTQAGGIISRLSGTTTCDFSDQIPSCSYLNDFAAPNGEIFRVENTSATQNDNGNWNASGTVYDSDLGSVEFSSSDVDRDCANGNFAGGTIEITDNSGNVVVTINFTGCNDCVVTFAGNSETYSQPDRG